MEKINLEVKKMIEESISVKESLKSEIPLIIKSANAIIKSLHNGGKVLFCGNGGSAADSQHIACEFIVKLTKKRKSLPAIALTTNTSHLTAISNDFSFEDIFSRQIEGLGRKGDVLVAISTSGNSPNILKAVESAKSIGMYTIGFTGAKGDAFAKKVNIGIKVPSSSTQRIQESHILIGHIICELVETEFCKISK
ncbi:MAG: D-sedoheptulose 7-phosphate isomerase [bacterium]